MSDASFEERVTPAQKPKDVVRMGILIAGQLDVGGRYAEMLRDGNLPEPEFVGKPQLTSDVAAVQPSLPGRRSHRCYLAPVQHMDVEFHDNSSLAHRCIGLVDRVGMARVKKPRSG